MAAAEQVYQEALPLINSGMDKRAALRQVASQLGITEGAAATSFYRAARKRPDAPVVPRPGRETPQSRARKQGVTRKTKAPARPAPARPTTASAAPATVTRTQIDQMAREIGTEIANLIATRIQQVEEENRRILEEKIERLRAAI